MKTLGVVLMIWSGFGFIGAMLIEPYIAGAVVGIIGPWFIGYSLYKNAKEKERRRNETTRAIREG